MLDELIPIVAIVAFFAVPIIGILVWHQQRMARLIHGDPATRQDPMLAQQIADLRQLVAQQAIAIDELSRGQRELLQRLPARTESPTLEERIRQ